MSVADRGEPEASCSEWHGDGTAGEDDRGSHVVAAVSARGDGRDPSTVTTCLVGKPPFGGAAALDSTRSLDR